MQSRNLIPKIMEFIINGTSYIKLLILFVFRSNFEAKIVYILIGISYTLFFLPFSLKSVKELILFRIQLVNPTRIIDSPPHTYV